MFEKLVESQTPDTSIGVKHRILAVTSLVVTVVAGLSILFSLFNQTLGMDGDPGSLTSLISPVIPEVESKSNLSSEPEKPAASKSKDTPTSRRDIVQRSEEVPVAIPTVVSSEPLRSMPRPIGDFLLGDRDSNAAFTGSSRGNPIGNSRFIGNDEPKSKITDSKPKTGNPLPEPPKLEVSKAPPAYVGVVNGKAVHLDKPDYPSVAKQLGVKGQVKVQVLIDESGNVVSATVVSGNRLLQNVSLTAAKASRFSPTLIGTRPVSVRGLIIYNFK